MRAICACECGLTQVEVMATSVLKGHEKERGDDGCRSDEELSKLRKIASALLISRQRNIQKMRVCRKCRIGLNPLRLHLTSSSSILPPVAIGTVRVWTTIMPNTCLLLGVTNVSDLILPPIIKPTLQPDNQRNEMEWLFTQQGSCVDVAAIITPVITALATLLLLEDEDKDDENTANGGDNEANRETRRGEKLAERMKNMGVLTLLLSSNGAKERNILAVIRAAQLLVLSQYQNVASEAWSWAENIAMLIVAADKKEDNGDSMIVSTICKVLSAPENADCCVFLCEALGRRDAAAAGIADIGTCEEGENQSIALSCVGGDVVRFLVLVASWHPSHAMVLTQVAWWGRGLDLGGCETKLDLDVLLRGGTITEIDCWLWLTLNQVLSRMMMIKGIKGSNNESMSSVLLLKAHRLSPLEIYLPVNK